MTCIDSAREHADGRADPARPAETPLVITGAAEASASAFDAVDLTRSYRLEGVSVDALRGVSLRIDQGEFVAILGPSGSGKSTLMHLLGCLDRPTTGILRVGGVDVSTLDDTQLAELRNETIGFVFQSFHLLARTSALDNVALPLVYRGVSRSERRRAAKEALEAVGLGHRLDHRPSQMSGGEQQRVAIARALVGDPKVVLADEPTGNLDTRNGADVMNLLQRLNEENGVAVVLVTHEPEVAERARRQVHVRDGLIELDTDRGTAPARGSRTGEAAGAGRTEPGEAVGGRHAGYGEAGGGRTGSGEAGGGRHARLGESGGAGRTGPGEAAGGSRTGSREDV